jgi:hypothetical protein
MIYRCSDGHLFTISLANRLFSVHLGFAKFGRCPVDGKWRLYRWMHKDQLTDRELTSVHNY